LSRVMRHLLRWDGRRGSRYGANDRAGGALANMLSEPVDASGAAGVCYWAYTSRRIGHAGGRAITAGLRETQFPHQLSGRQGILFPIGHTGCKPDHSASIAANLDDKTWPIRRIREERRHGRGLREIAQRLDSAGIQCRGGRWSHTTFRSVLLRSRQIAAADRLPPTSRVISLAGMRPESRTSPA